MKQDPKVTRALRAARKCYADGGATLGPSYLEPGEMPVEKPDTIYDVAMRYARALRNMGRTVEPGERGSILPIMATERGVAPAVPGIIQQPAEDWKAMVDSGYRPTGEAVNPDRDRMAERSFNVAGVAPVAGLAAAAVRPGTSLGSGGGKLTKSLPMDDASRMARAREMGFDTERTLYHGTNKEFDEFRPSDRGALGPGVYFSQVPGVAQNYGRLGEYYVRGNVLNTKPFRDIPYGLVDAVKSQLTADEVKRWERLWPNTYDAYGNPKLPPDAETFREVLTRSVQPERVPQIMRRAGYDGLEGIADGHEVTMFDPRNIRSVNAAFDPDQIDSANLLAANSSKASTPGLAALESNRVRGGLPMDEASRMARARELGYDTDRVWYHGTNERGYTELKPDMRDPGLWLTTDKMNASNYARGDDADLHYLRAKPGKSFVVESADDVTFKPSHEGSELPFDNNVDIVRHAFANGYDSVRFPYGNFSESGDTLVVRRGNQVRSVDAEFDPSKASSTNLLAANPSTAAILAFLDKYREKK